VFRLVETVTGGLVAYTDPTPAGPGHVRPDIYTAE
jgi:hypothetical protein